MNTSKPFSEARPPKSTGRKILSIVPPRAPHMAIRMTARPACPVENSQIAPGIQTGHAPTTGSSDKKAHHHAPEHGRTQPHNGKRSAANRPLNCRNHQARRDARENQLASLRQHPLRHGFLKWQKKTEAVQDRIAVAKEIKQRKQHDEQFEQEHDDIPNHRGQARWPCIPRPGWRPGAQVRTNPRLSLAPRCGR